MGAGRRYAEPAQCLFAPAEFSLSGESCWRMGVWYLVQYGERDLSLWLAIQIPACWKLRNLLCLNSLAPGSLLVNFLHRDTRGRNLVQYIMEKQPTGSDLVNLVLELSLGQCPVTSVIALRTCKYPSMFPVPSVWHVFFCSLWFFLIVNPVGFNF